MSPTKVSILRKVQWSPCRHSLCTMMKNTIRSLTNSIPIGETKWRNLFKNLIFKYILTERFKVECWQRNEARSLRFLAFRLRTTKLRRDAIRPWGNENRLVRAGEKFPILPRGRDTRNYIVYLIYFRSPDDRSISLTLLWYLFNIGTCWIRGWFRNCCATRSLYDRHGTALRYEL